MTNDIKSASTEFCSPDSDTEKQPNDLNLEEDNNNNSSSNSPLSVSEDSHDDYEEKEVNNDHYLVHAETNNIDSYIDNGMTEHIGDIQLSTNNKTSTQSDENWFTEQKRDFNTPAPNNDENFNGGIDQFIETAHSQGYNCLDLTKKCINEFPSKLLKFDTLEYLYLEGNELKTLPENIFVQLVVLKWLDLRNNHLHNVPNKGLEKHMALRYLLLGGNLIKTLPSELGKVKTLSALNLDGNPLEFPPLDVIKQGLKAIQIFLREEHIRQSKIAHRELDSDDENYDQERDISLINDIWASDDDDGNGRKQPIKYGGAFSNFHYVA
ncbi:unnamed protein product [Didymodactylos carnosus]|uniref:Leucine-rich repeat-containing protein n=1 Tax=Didymodactylos carnosus TaxID=1234261 RepID=A0A8S2CYG1_9BILA|nr:unnamed protein product [Didymodactylos carnosus]CAF3618333.1 unnamed protein product [Didymodactylos carnosus]